MCDVPDAAGSREDIGLITQTAAGGRGGRLCLGNGKVLRTGASPRGLGGKGEAVGVCDVWDLCGENDPV
jgi:hypothetical protein